MLGVCAQGRGAGGHPLIRESRSRLGLIRRGGGKSWQTKGPGAGVAMMQR